jgi:hypothetical protein
LNFPKSKIDVKKKVFLRASRKTVLAKSENTCTDNLSFNYPLGTIVNYGPNLFTKACLQVVIIWELLILVVRRNFVSYDRKIIFHVNRPKGLFTRVS